MIFKKNRSSHDLMRELVQNSRDGDTAEHGRENGYAALTPRGTKSILWLRCQADEHPEKIRSRETLEQEVCQNVALLSRAIRRSMNSDEHSCTQDSTGIVEDMIQAAVGSSNDVRSRQAKEALRSEGFKDIEDMKTRIKCVGDLVGMGVPFPQAKAVWKAIHAAQNGKNPGECTERAPIPPVSEKELPVLPGVKMHKSLHEWSDSPFDLRCMFPGVSYCHSNTLFAVQARPAGSAASR
jgi:hypothetical protein